MPIYYNDIERDLRPTVSNLIAFIFAMLCHQHQWLAQAVCHLVCHQN
jgi:hypothetical protein